MQPWSLAALVCTTAHLGTIGDKKGSILRKYDHLRVGVVEPQACPASQLLPVAPHRSNTIVPHTVVTPCCANARSRSFDAAGNSHGAVCRPGVLLTMLELGICQRASLPACRLCGRSGLKAARQQPA